MRFPHPDPDIPSGLSGAQIESPQMNADKSEILKWISVNLRARPVRRACPTGQAGLHSSP